MSIMYMIEYLPLELITLIADDVHGLMTISIPDYGLDSIRKSRQRVLKRKYQNTYTTYKADKRMKELRSKYWYTEKIILYTASILEYVIPYYFEGFAEHLEGIFDTDFYEILEELYEEFYEKYR